MRHLIHKYQQPIWIALTIFVIASFVLFWNGSMMSHGVLGNSVKVASIYGRPITDTEYVRDAHMFMIAKGLGMNDLVAPLVGNPQNEEEAQQNYVFNSDVFNHEADDLQIQATDAEMQQALTEIPGFQTDGKFDSNKLTQFVAEKLPSLGFSDSVIDDLVREQVRVKKVLALIGATVQVSPAEMSNRYSEEQEKMQMQIIRLNKSDLQKTIQVSDADAQKAYNAHKETFVTPEMRKVEVASFELTPDEQKLTGKDRTDALQKLSDASWAFAQAVVDKSANFDEQAKKAGAPITTTAFFSADQPDPAYTKIPGLATSAFRLTSDLPSSDVLEGQNGYYVLHLAGYTPSKQETFEEAKPAVIAQVQKERADQLMQTAANDTRAKLDAALKSGKSFADAAKALGLAVETPPAFSLETVNTVDIPDIQQIIQPAVALNSGELSNFIETQAGGAFVYMQSRQPVSAAQAIIGVLLEKDRYQTRKEQGAFEEWLRTRREAARLQLVQQQA